MPTEDWRAEKFFENSKCKKELRLKEGAQVMCIVNAFSEEGIVNGSIGVVRSFDEDGVEVEFSCGFVKIGRYTWEIEEDGKTVLTVSQIPLVLGWAITIHKSQGMTIDYLRCDLSRVFADGQAYVALSRARSRE